MSALVALVRPATTRAHIVTLPYAGAGAHAYRDWTPAVPAGVALWGMRLPGRENRIDEIPYRDAATAGADLVGELAALPPPVALFGHSFGALLAHRLAADLTARGRPPVLVGLSGLSPRPDRTVLSHTDGDAKLVASLRELGGTPADVLDDPELMRVMLPVIRADLATVHASMPVTGPALYVPVALFGGLSDPTTGRDELLRWTQLCRGEVGVRMFTGGHFFVLRTEVAQAFGADLTRRLRGWPAVAVRA